MGVESGLDELNFNPVQKQALSDGIDFILGTLETVSESIAKGDFNGADFAVNNILKPGAMHLGNQFNLILAYDKAADIVAGKTHFLKIDGIAGGLADATAYSAVMNVISLYEALKSFYDLWKEVSDLTDDLITINDVYKAAQDVYLSALKTPPEKHGLI